MIEATVTETQLLRADDAFHDAGVQRMSATRENAVHVTLQSLSELLQGRDTALVRLGKLLVSADHVDPAALGALAQ
ncbi:hypothetical protein AWB78_07153 [Caballeronia calidae]|uniref:Uncharacterized protein n=2 Tax=Caballeronia calidae TaxID=1777139 RepID=A0A158ED65_9BURK|nr:hypothetical protein AWB78_07153 [Caballeronia calidae]